jgi:hypothetical protein
MAIIDPTCHSVHGVIMLERAHKHIISDLQQGARTDTIFVITAVVFNLIVLAVNSAVAGEAASAESNNSTTNDVVLVIFIIMNIIVNTIAIGALTVGKQTRDKLLHGLLAMYQDNDVAKYYDDTLLTNYNRRYTLFMAVILCLAATAIIVPLVIRLL